MLAQHTTNYTLTLKEKSSFGIKLFHIVSQLDGRISHAVLGSISQDLEGKNLPFETHIYVFQYLKLCWNVVFFLLCLFFPVVVNTLKFDFFLNGINSTV